MSQEKQLADQLFGQGQEQKPMGALQAVKEAVLAVAPGLKDFGPEVKQQLAHMGAHGAHELAAALFNNSGFVMYPRGTREDHGVHGPEQSAAPDQHAQDTHDQPTQQHHRGGRSL